MFEATLSSVSVGGRMLSLIVNDSTGYTLDMPLNAVPQTADLEWTQRMPMRLSEMKDAGYTYTTVLVRYRVVKKGVPQE